MYADGLAVKNWSQNS